MRLSFVLAAVGVLLHVARPPDAILLPDVAQQLWPLPRLRLPPVDLTLVEVGVMEGWQTRPIVVTAEELRSDRFLWRQMFPRNWDRLEAPLREQGLAEMHRAHRGVLRGPDTWRAMDAEAWDRVPQPMRAMAVLGMIDCWQRRYRPGERFRLADKPVADRMKAIAMSESWFMHRATSANPDGGEDIGIGQTSTATRSRIRVLHVRGDSDFGLADDEYFDPWKATRALVYWFALLLEEAAGDLELATRAYNVGMERALAGRGGDYLEGVLRREKQYLLGPGPSPSWRWLLKRSRSACPHAASEPGPAARRMMPEPCASASAVSTGSAS